MKTKYLVIWHYMANYGHVEVEAETFEDAKEIVWNGREDIEYFVIPADAVQHYPAIEKKKGD